MKVSLFTDNTKDKDQASQMTTMLIASLKKSGINCEVINLIHYDIANCINCKQCEQDAMHCAQTDGMTDLSKKMEKSDVLIFASPNHWLGTSNQLKLLLDRFRPYFLNRKLNGKKGALLLLGSLDPINTELFKDQFKRVYKALGMVYIGTITSHAFENSKLPNNGQVHDFLTDMTNRILEESN